MTRNQAIKELAGMQERIQFLNLLIERTTPPPPKGTPYGCQQYDPARLCKYDRRAIDSKCDWCPRVSA